MTDAPAPDTPLPPSGRQLRFGEHGVAVTLGGGVRTAPGLEGYAEDELPSGGRGQLLAPWPNRLARGRWSWRGRDLQLPLSEVPDGDDPGAAIHGLVRWAEWVEVPPPAGAPAGSASLSHVLAPQPGYPFRLHLTATYSPAPDGFAVHLAAVNLAAEPAPFGLGEHPYLDAGVARVDDLELAVPGLADERVGDRVLDDHVRSAPGPDGVRAVLRGPERTVELWADEAFGHLQVFSGDTLPAARRRTGLAVEPMTCPPQALATGEDLVVLEPGEAWSGSWGVRVRATGG